MKLLRAMSIKEFNLMLGGAELENTKTYSKNRTSSQGFCFIKSCNSKMYVFDDYTNTYVKCVYPGIMLMQGCILPAIVNYDKNKRASHDVVVEFQTTKEFGIHATKSFGIYAEPYTIGSWDTTIEVREYCINQYSRDILIPLRYWVLDNGRGLKESEFWNVY